VNRRPPAATTTSLVICTLDRPASVGRLLEALRHQVQPPQEVLVIDASTDGATADVVDSARAGWPGDGLRHVDARADRGLTRQRNVGIAASTGEVVAFLDDDTVPDPGYTAELLACFDRHPDAVGVGGTIVEDGWVPSTGPARSGWYQADGQERAEGARWRLRRRLGLDAGAPPGTMPPSGHGRPIAFLPPSGEDHQVEFLMGGASAWRRTLLDDCRFDPGFEGYGLYEDLELCLAAGERGALYVAGAARLRHEHAAEARPDPGRYGRMVVVNGWYVWRRRWPRPRPADRLRWWATTAVLAACRLPDGRDGRREAAGRMAGMLRTVPCELSPARAQRRYAQHSRVATLVPADGGPPRG
jgi:GT2 family glycosyltransferase